MPMDFENRFLGWGGSVASWVWETVLVLLVKISVCGSMCKVVIEGGGGGEISVIVF